MHDIWRAIGVDVGAFLEKIKCGLSRPNDDCLFVENLEVYNISCELLDTVCRITRGSKHTVRIAPLSIFLPWHVYGYIK